MKIKFLKEGLTLAEIHSKGLKYALLDNKFNPLHQEVLCKDFLTDVIWCETNNKYDVPIYGFKYSNKEYKLTKQDKLHIAIYDTEKDICTVEKAETLQLLLNSIEDNLKFKNSSVAVMDNALVIEFSSEWIKEPYLLSLFTLMLRVGVNSYDKTPFKEFLFDKYRKITIPVDGGTLHSLQDKLKAIFDRGILPKVGYNFDSIGRAHNSGGILSTKSELFV